MEVINFHAPGKIHREYVQMAQENLICAERQRDIDEADSSSQPSNEMFSSDESIL